MYNNMIWALFKKNFEKILKYELWPYGHTTLSLLHISTMETKNDYAVRYSKTRSDVYHIISTL